MTERRAERRRQTPKTIDTSSLDFDIFGELLSFYVRSVGLALNRDYDRQIAEVALAHGTGKVSTLLLVAANPGIRPSVVAHYILKDRSSMVKLLDQLKRGGLIEQRVSASERRAHELYLTPKGEALIARVRAIAIEQSDAFFAILDEAERGQLLTILKKLYAHHVAELPSGG